MAKSTKRKLSLVCRLSYSVGHVLNDLCASMWFSYLLIYFHMVKNFENSRVGDLILIGQITDAVCTPLVGYESDRTKGFCKLGKRKSWHFLGSLCVAISFPFLFAECITCSHAPDWAQFFYYAAFIVIFQFGWAATQIAHLALIPDLTKDEHERVELNGWRYAFTVLSNLSVYGIAWLLFARNSGSESDPTNLGPNDSTVFRNLVLIVVGIGIVFSSIFHIGVKERKPAEDPKVPPLYVDDAEISHTVHKEKSPFKGPFVQMTIKDWLKEYQFYQVGFIYMFTRLYVNVSQVYLANYLLDTLSLDKETIAIVPLIVYTSGFLTSLVMKPVNKIIGRKATYLIGSVFAGASCCWLYFIKQHDDSQIYGAAVLLGIGTSTLQVTSLAMTADLIGLNTSCCAFVYGVMSFTDKLSNGLAIALTQHLQPCLSHVVRTSVCTVCKQFYRHLESCMTGGFVAFAVIILLTLLPQQIGQRRKAVLQGAQPAINVNGSIDGEHSNYESISEKEPLFQNSTNASHIDIRTSMNSPYKDMETLK